jgi:uncharacterized SAM-binding protein YcdF (DUF218 family)
MSYGETDAIIALAGGIDSAGALVPRNYQRLDTAIDLFQEGVAPHLIVTGGWSFLSRQPERTEAEQMKEYAISKGVPESAILTEDDSHDTIGQAVFVKQQLLIPRSWNSLTLVTSESHLSRSERLFDHVLGEGYIIHGVSAPENRGIKERVWEAVGSLMLDYVITGTEKGDDRAIEQRLTERVPGYGGKVTTRQLAIKSLLSILN